MNNSIHLYANVQGNPINNHIILLHGLFGSHDNLRTLQQDLSSKNFCVHGLDLRNHGRSDWSDKMDYSSMADDLINYVRNNSLSNLSLIGHSMGGKVVMQALLKEPLMFKNAVVLDIAPVNYTPTHEQIFLGLSTLPLQSLENRKEADAHMEKFVSNLSIRQFLLKNLIKNDVGKYNLRINLRVIMNNYSNILSALNYDTPSRVPVLFIKGENSSYIKEEHKTIINSIFPNNTISEISNTSHWVHYESPKKVFNLILHHFAQFP